DYDEENGWTFGNETEDYTQGMNLVEGMPKAWTAGLHFSNKWDEQRKKLNLNYRFLKNNQRAGSETISQFILPDTQYFNTTATEAFSSVSNHSGKGIYDLKFDSLSSMKINVTGNNIQSQNASRLMSSALNADGGNVNDNDRFMNTQTSKNNMNANLLLRKKFKLKGRTLSVDFEQRASELQSDGFLNSSINYFNSSGNVDSLEKIDQKKNNKQNSFGVKGNIVYTEPISKILFLSVNYGMTYRNDESFRSTFNNSGGEYTKKDSTLSNDFRFRYDVQSAGLDIKLNKKKMMVTVGSGINYSVFRQTDLLTDTSQRYSFVNYFPKVFIKLTPGPQKSFTFRYNGRTNQPALDQLQPVRENTDPLNIRIGNPDLRQEFAHNINLWYNNYKILKNRGIFTSLNTFITERAISSSTVTDKGGKTTYQSINTKGNFNTSGNFFYGWRAQKLGIYFEIGNQFTYGRNRNRVNNLDNINNSANYTFFVGLNNYKENKYYYYFRPNIGYTFSKSSLRPDVQIKYLTSGTEFSLWMKVLKKFEISTNGSINLRERTDAFETNRNSFKWDAYISRKFLKKDNLELKLAAYDILNQNIGFSRNATSNIITENSYNTLKRYFMISIQYSINKTP
ncbi:MAG TPA: outer membrane beta-barrel protein, partial [Flavitalea sp.]|nr:outer membrane beta-barrel protein [Flavitalea sp.]